MKRSNRYLVRIFFLCVLSSMLFQNLSFGQPKNDFTFQGIEISIPENVATVSFNELNMDRFQSLNDIFKYTFSGLINNNKNHIEINYGRKRIAKFDALTDKAQ